MTKQNHSNTAVDTTLTAAINAAVTTIPVAATTGWPSAPFYVVLTPGDASTEEVVLVTAVVGLNLTATRAADGTTAKSHLINATVRHAAIAFDLEGYILGGKEVDSAAPSSGQAPVYNGSKYVATDIATQAELDSEATARASADTTLQTNITAEATARTTADALRLLITSNLSDLNNVTTARSNLGLGNLAVLSSITASLISDASANGRSLIAAADYAAMKVLLALTIGTNVQAWDADLDTLATMGNTRAALLAALPAYIQTLLDDTTATAALATLGAMASVAEGRFVGAGTTYYTIPGMGAIATTSTKVLTASRIQYEPFFVRTTTSYDQMICEVTSAGAGGTVIRMAIYPMDTDGQPGARSVDAGTVAADSLGIKTASITLTLNPGRYQKALISDGTPTLRSYRGGGLSTPFDTGLGTSPVVGGLRVAGSGFALPDPGTAWTAINALSAGFDHTILLRVSTP